MRGLHYWSNPDDHVVHVCDFAEIIFSLMKGEGKVPHFTTAADKWCLNIKWQHSHFHVIRILLNQSVFKVVKGEIAKWHTQSTWETLKVQTNQNRRWGSLDVNRLTEKHVRIMPSSNKRIYSEDVGINQGRTSKSVSAGDQNRASSSPVSMNLAEQRLFLGVYLYFC